MRVMTFNLRFENDRDGQNSWIYRRDLVVAIVRRYRPDVLGTQEGRWTMLQYLAEALQDYAIHAPHRVLDDTCQYPTLFLRKDWGTVVDGAEFWLSRTPQVHRSKDWDSAFPRMMSWARVVEKSTGADLWVSVTHLDHMGAEARVEQARILAQWVQEHFGAHIVMGDFNDGPESTVHRLLTHSVVGLQDSWRVAGRGEGDAEKTHHGFSGVPQKSRMDWILISRHFHVREAHIVRDHFEGRYPSDHFPYYADLQWINSPSSTETS
ncbi:endonuclease/exonuclease/phosphatase family protein [Desulfosoma caldarium]|uniref:Endonuclease/exonuclease/phosphatase family metal-dependent hydrolase n=1 Tax=Desulfosoma caldarium TaxID=610254 RepID=A0A3N1UXL9_9BACT|nr:endonuclease/exonuclease/phosphatase family protein [Desulfosoma caldarium]ROQ93287.1 endonuclease/exonuclease/phosphatase family metal-dependent hydrolase [Desulfosoma caldarium]